MVGFDGQLGSVLRAGGLARGGPANSFQLDSRVLAPMGKVNLLLFFIFGSFIQNLDAPKEEFV